MTTARAGAPDPDPLTRTTLQIDVGTPALSLTHAIAALQRVPGVLLAELNAASARATVAHDAAVPPASLLAAVAGAGAHAKIVADTRDRALAPSAGLPLGHVRTRRLMTGAAAVFVPLALLDVLLPSTVNKTWLLPVFISALWVFFFAEAFVGRRR